MSRNSVPALSAGTHLGFDEPLGRLDLGFTESSSVFGADVRPYSQVGGLLQGLKASENRAGFKVFYYKDDFLA